MGVCYPKTYILFDRCLSEFDPQFIKTNISNKMTKKNLHCQTNSKFQFKNRKTRDEIYPTLCMTIYNLLHLVNVCLSVITFIVYARLERRWGRVGEGN